MFNYAQLRDDDTVQGVCTVPEEMTGYNLIPIQELNTREMRALLNKRYNRVTGLFEEVV